MAVNSNDPWSPFAGCDQEALSRALAAVFTACQCSPPPAAPITPGENVFGERLRLARERRGMSGAELGRLAGGYGRNSVSQWETGVRKNPRLETVKKLAAVLGVSVEWLLGSRGSRDPIWPF